MYGPSRVSQLSDVRKFSVELGREVGGAEHSDVLLASHISQSGSHNTNININNTRAGEWRVKDGVIVRQGHAGL